MSQPVADRRGHTKWSQIFRRRPDVPSWLVSAVFHAVIFIVLALTVRAAPRAGAAPERIADVGIVLKHQDGEREYYENPGDVGQDAAAAAVAAEAAGAVGLDQALPAEAPMNADAALPEAMNIIGISAAGEGL